MHAFAFIPSFFAFLTIYYCGYSLICLEDGKIDYLDVTNIYKDRKFLFVSERYTPLKYKKMAIMHL